MIGAWRTALGVSLLIGSAMAGQDATPAAAACSMQSIAFPDGSSAITFDVEIADEPHEQSRGLMFRPSLPADAGMLFVYPEPQRASFWMKNTMISLDMIFIDDTGTVESIAARTVPYSLAPKSSDGPVRAVLEINGGRAEELGIEPGDQAVHPSFAEAPEPHRCGAD